MAVRGPAPTPTNRGASIAIIVAGVVPVVALLVLRALGVPLGQPGKFTYLYSELAAVRMRSLAPALSLAWTAAAGVWLLASGGRRRALAGGTLASISVVGFALWAYFAPPAHISQHVFNFRSPSQDGAFVNEAAGVTDVRAYLAGFPQRARTPPTEMRGTRVISNPPGATLMAVAAGWLLERVPGLRELAVASIDEKGLAPGFARRAAQALVFAWLLLLMWAAAAAVLYLAGREFLPRDVAAALALCGTISAATLLFSPGKDPAQLLSAALLLWTWLRAFRRDAVLWAVLAGVVLVPACLLSLVHVWIAAILVVATIGPIMGDRATLLRRIVRLVLPAALGAAACAAGLQLAWGVNVVETVRAVAASQAEVTRTGPDAMPLAWQLLGVPLFLLFCGPAVWCAGLAALTKSSSSGAGGSAAAEHRQMGVWLIAATTIVMLATIGFTNAETPRLWIPFVPLLLLGAAMRFARVTDGSKETRTLLTLLVLAQLAASAAQWTVMDMREAEMRLIQRTPDASPRLFD